MRVSNIDSLPDSALISAGEIAQLVGCDPSTVWRWSATSRIPKPVRLSPKCSRWRLGALRAALARLAGEQLTEQA